MKIILVTHAQSNKDIGLDDNSEGLSEVGKIEARQIALALKDEKIDYIYCSPALRVKETMEVILSEKENENIGISFSRFLRPKSTKEDLAKLKIRTQVVIDELPYDHEDDQTVLLITHRLVAKMIAFLMGVGEGIDIEQASISRFKLSRNEKKVLKLNDAEHLK